MAAPGVCAARVIASAQYSKPSYLRRSLPVTCASTELGLQIGWRIRLGSVASARAGQPVIFPPGEVITPETVVPTVGGDLKSNASVPSWSITRPLVPMTVCVALAG